jgi:hypothetical protein
MLYSVKRFTYETKPDPKMDPKKPKKTIKVRQCVTVKSGLTWKQAKAMRAAERSLIIFEGSEGPQDGEQILNEDVSTTPSWRDLRTVSQMGNE